MSNLDKYAEFLTTAEFADVTGLERRYIQMLAKEGIIQTLPGTKRIKIHKSEATPERLARLPRRARRILRCKGGKA